MKYIVIKDSVVGEFAVFCLAPQTHAQLATAWRRDDTRQVVSAGFCEFLGTGAVLVFGRSDGLDLGNRGTKDAALIAAMYHGTVEMSRRADSGESAGYATRRAVVSKYGPLLALTSQLSALDSHLPATPASP